MGRKVSLPALVSPPGTRFHYSSGSTNVVGDVVRERTGQTLADFARERLLEPLGITSFSWTGFTAAPNVVVASSNLYLRPRDMAKFGELYLRGGVWQGTRIVSEQWVRQSTAASIQVPPSENSFPGLADSYGYQWWRHVHEGQHRDLFRRRARGAIHLRDARSGVGSGHHRRIL